MFKDADFRQRKVLVTGASGFIGSRLCERLTECGATVHGVSREPRDNTSVSMWWQADLEDEHATRQVVQAVEPDYIFHLASFVSGKREVEFVLPALRNNLLSTVNLLVAATHSGCPKVVLTGSLEEPEGNIETAVPSSPYAAAKGAASQYARMFHVLYGTPVVTARLFMVYGPNQKDLAKLVPYVTLSLLRGKIPDLMSGTREIDWIFIDDVVDAYLAIARNDRLNGETIDIGSGVLTSVRSIVENLVEIILPGTRLEFGGVADRPLERVRVADVERTYTLTGWKPRKALAEGLAQTVDWYRNTLQDF
jgi:nucleoside-diphosphate-sugar epimerase